MYNMYFLCDEQNSIKFYNTCMKKNIDCVRILSVYGEKWMVGAESIEQIASLFFETSESDDILLYSYVPLLIDGVHNGAGFYIVQKEEFVLFKLQQTPSIMERIKVYTKDML